MSYQYNDAFTAADTKDANDAVAFLNSVTDMELDYYCKCVTMARNKPLCTYTLTDLGIILTDTLRTYAMSLLNQDDRDRILLYKTTNAELIKQCKISKSNRKCNYANVGNDEILIIHITIGNLRAMFPDALSDYIHCKRLVKWKNTIRNRLHARESQKKLSLK
jgi:hypothetical protein